MNGQGMNGPRKGNALRAKRLCLAARPRLTAYAHKINRGYATRTGSQFFSFYLCAHHQFSVSFLCFYWWWAHKEKEKKRTASSHTCWSTTHKFLLSFLSVTESWTLTMCVIIRCSHQPLGRGPESGCKPSRCFRASPMVGLFSFISFLMVREDGTASAASGSRTKKRVKEKRECLSIICERPAVRNAHSLREPFTVDRHS